MAAEEKASPSLWKHRDFLLLWSGQTISDMGSAVTTLAIPLLAITLLHATAFEMGLLTASGTVAYLLVALPAGVLIDRVAKRRVMLVCDLAKGLVLATVPICSLVGGLSIGLLYAVTFISGCLAVFFEIAYQSFVPVLLDRDRLVDGNSKIGTTNSFATVVGPTLAGSLVALLGGAARAIVVDCFSFGVSVVSLAAIRRREPAAAARGGGKSIAGMRADIAAGFGYVVRHPVLRRIVLCTAMSNLFNSMSSAILVLFMATDLAARSATIGLVMGLGSVGGIVGGLIGRPLARTFGSARMLWLGKLSLGGITLLVPLAQRGAGVFLISAGVFAAAVSAVVYNVSQVSYRQAMCPPDMLGRMNASVRWIIRGVMPIGALLGGALATGIGLRATLLVSFLGSWLAVLWIVLSPMRGQREIPVHEGYGASAKTTTPATLSPSPAPVAADASDGPDTAADAAGADSPTPVPQVP